MGQIIVKMKAVTRSFIARGFGDIFLRSNIVGIIPSRSNNIIMIICKNHDILMYQEKNVIDLSITHNDVKMQILNMDHQN